MIARFSDATLA